MGSKLRLVTKISIFVSAKSSTSRSTTRQHKPESTWPRSASDLPSLAFFISRYLPDCLPASFIENLFGTYVAFLHFPAMSEGTCCLYPVFLGKSHSSPFVVSFVLWIPGIYLLGEAPRRSVCIILFQLACFHGRMLASRYFFPRWWVRLYVWFSEHISTCQLYDVKPLVAVTA